MARGSPFTLISVELENLKQVVQQVLMLPDDARLELVIQPGGVLIVPVEQHQKLATREALFARWDAMAEASSDEQVAALKDEFGDEDVALAEALLPDYDQNLRAEDSK
jgi:hypothetical protein